MRAIILTLLMCLLQTPVFAEGYDATYQKIAELNQIKPTKSLKLRSFDKILLRPVNDSGNRAVGSVTDVLVNAAGNVETLMVSLDKLRLSQEVAISFQNGPIDAQYAFYVFKSYNADQITELYPEFLAGIATAAGADDIFAVSKIKNSRVKNDRGITLAKVSDILFNEQGTKAMGLLITTLDNRKVIAIPFDAGMISGDTQKEIILQKEQEKAVTDFLKRR